MLGTVSKCWFKTIMQVIANHPKSTPKVRVCLKQILPNIIHNGDTDNVLSIVNFILFPLLFSRLLMIS